MLNQRGLAIDALAIFITIIGIIGAFYFVIQKNALKLAAESNNPTIVSRPRLSSTILKSLDPVNLAISGFPIYPSSEYIGTKDYEQCEEGKYSGFSICNAQAHTWNVKASFDDIINFYNNSNSGWICQGGAGSYEDTNNASGVTSCVKENFKYGLFIETKNGISSITLTIPKGPPTSK